MSCCQPRAELLALRSVLSRARAVLLDSELPSTAGLVALEEAVEAHDKIAKSLAVERSKDALREELIGAYREAGREMKKEAGR